ncbi:MAG: thiamine pyrophosphate-binding protein [Armatimonadota bacterium]
MSHASSFSVPPVPPAEFLSALSAQGYDFFTGVPCSLVSGLIAELEAHPETRYYAETREDAAIGLACGASMAGRQPVVVMQNSGLGVSINALSSLTLMYRTPCLLLITWRGYEPNDAPEHILMGQVCGSLLETLGIPYRAPEPATLLDDLAWATDYQRTHSEPAALLLRSGVTL